MKTKNAAARVKAGPDDGLEEGQFTAYASTFTKTPDSYGDIVLPGAFTDTLAEWAEKDAPIPLLYGHRFDDPDYNIGHIVKAVEDDHGLLVTGQLDLESPKAKQVYRLLKGKRIEQMSFAYDVVEGANAKIDDQDVYELRKLNLYEVSIVPIGANQETEILAVKNIASAIQAQAKAGRVLAQKHIDSLRAAQEAIGAVIDAAEQDQEKANGEGPVKDEEPGRAKSDEPRTSPPASTLATQLKLMDLG